MSANFKQVALRPMRIADEFLDIAVSNGLLAGRRRGILSRSEQLRYHLDAFFGGVDPSGLRVLDVGGGKGLLSLSAAAAGAHSVVCLEPAADGSQAGAASNFDRIAELLGVSNIAKLDARPVLDYLAAENCDESFDLVVMGNSINHLDEEACVGLLTNPAAKQRYGQIFGAIARATVAGAPLIMTDCGSRNLFGDLSLPNPVAAGIEWEKHQQPQVWASVAAESGFDLRSIDWTTFDQFGKWGRPLAPWPVAYMLRSHFRLELSRA